MTGRWSHDGAGIVTGGEDGAVKIWSRSGMLRSTLAHNTMPVYALAWSPDSSQVRFNCNLIHSFSEGNPTKPIHKQQFSDSLVMFRLFTRRTSC